MAQVQTTALTFNRDRSIDALRGLAMVLVVVGHTLGAAFPNTYLSNPAQVVLFSFHLPLFAAVSGYLMYGKEFNPARVLTKRFKALMIPYFSWYVVWWAVSYSRGDRTSLWNGLFRAAMSPLTQNALWFLYSLFLTNAVFALVMTIRPTPKAVTVSFLVSVLLYASGVFENIWLFDPVRVSWLYIFFALGYLCAGPWFIRKNKVRTVGLGSALLYVGSLACTATVRADGTRSINLLIGEGTLANIMTRMLLVVAAASACALLWVLFRRAPSAVLSTFGFIGVRSTGIYAMHKRLIFMTLELGFSGFWMPFIVALGGSTLLTLVLERIPIMSNAFLGKNPLRNQDQTRRHLTVPT